MKKTMMNIPMSNVSPLQIDPGRCFYCETELNKYSHTQDHLWPKAQGGSDDPENKVNACDDCNKLKGNRTPLQFMKALEMVRFEACRQLKKSAHRYNRMIANTKRVLDAQREKKQKKRKG